MSKRVLPPPSHERVAAAWRLIERREQYDNAGGCTSWRDKLCGRLARREVQETVERVIESLTEAVESKEVTTIEDLDQRLNEECDGYLIYNLSASVYLLGTENEDAYDNEIGESGASVSVRATYALIQDVRDDSRYQALYARLEEIEDGGCPKGGPGCDAPDDGEWHCHDACEGVAS